MSRRIAHFFPDALSRSALVVLLLLVAIGLVGPFMAFLGDPRAVGVGPRLAAPAGEWPFGTDPLGRSLLPRAVEGIRLSFLLASTAVLITSVIGVALGLVAGYFRSFGDEIIARIADVLFSFPAILLAILISAMFVPGTPAAIATIVLITLPLMIRVVRAATLVLADRDFVQVTLIAGGSHRRVLVVHILPNIAGAVIIQAAYAVSIGMIVESGISFLGLGVQPPSASLGSLLREGTTYLTAAPWLVFVPGAILSLAILSVNLAADGLRDALDPRERRV